MTKIKGMAKLNKAISTELKPFGISKAECGNEFSYDFVDESVSYKIWEDEMGDKWFNEFVAERFNYDAQKYSFIISLLHEIGHHNTDDDIGESVRDFCEKEKIRIATAYENETDYNKKRQLQFQYFNLPDEIMATAWAIDYATAHPKKIKKMFENSMKALKEFYNENLDEEC